MKPTVETPPSNAASAMMTAVALAAVCAAGLGYVFSQWQQTAQERIRVYESQGKWIEPSSDLPAYTACLRREIFVPSEVKHAWVSIAAKDAFELLVNRSPIGKHYLWRPTRPFQSGLSERGQKLSPLAPAMAMNFPREYQWADTGTAGLPVFVDITRFVKTGKNVLGLDLESRSAPARACIDGQITLYSGETISLASDASWRCEPVPPGLRELHWSAAGYDDSNWRYAKTAAAPTKCAWQTFATEIFTQAFRGNWLRHPQQSSHQTVWFGKTWRIPNQPTRAWLRTVVNRPADIFVNGVRLRGNLPTRNPTDAGQWGVGHSRNLDPVARPELLDPDEVDSLFTGQRFESPRGAANDPWRDWTDSLSAPRSSESKLADRPAITRRPAGWSAAAERQQAAFPASSTPKSLTRDFAVGAYTGYEISHLLRQGENTIAVRLSKPSSIHRPNWTPRLAVDGGAVCSGQRPLSLVSGSDWETWLQTDGDQLTERTAALEAGPALRPGNRLPWLQYAGAVTNPHQAAATFRVMGRWVIYGVAIVVVINLLSAATTLLAVRRARTVRTLLVSVNRWAIAAMLPPVALVSATLLIRCAWVEREEILWFMQPTAWRGVLALAGLLAWITTLVTIADRSWLMNSAGFRANVARRLEHLPHSMLWKFGIVWMLLFAGFLRVYALDFQPLDDDEYASTQAILSIAKTGVPSFVPEGVWYTRSPLYHYMMGAVVWLFGENLWSLRLPSALFGVATAWLSYLIGTRIMGRPWIGLGALLLLAIHPYEVFTGHVARFYQAQQFFALLTLYYFIKGFVVGQQQKYRYATVLAFLASVLCQEITAVLGVQLAIGYFLFAKDLGWRANTKLIALSLIAILVIVLDFLVFQTRCLTRVEGVSPTIEATVKPHLWHVYNFFALYIGYSRLHVVLSFCLVLGLPKIWKERDRATLALHFMLFAGVVLINLLVTHVSLRYQYWLIPLWILLSLDAMRAIVEMLGKLSCKQPLSRRKNNWVQACCGLILFVAVILSWSPWKMMDSYHTKLLGDSTGAMQWVRHHKLANDKIMATEPHTHAGVIEVGQIDYDLSVPLLYDFVLLDEGKLIDRNGGAEAIYSLQQLQRVFREQSRVWILVNREKFRSRGKNIRWQYPGARIELFLRSNCQLAHRTYLWSVFLWDANAGKMKLFRADGA